VVDRASAHLRWCALARSTTTRAGGSGTGAVWLDRWYIPTLPLLPQQMHIHVIELGSNQDEPDHLAAWFRVTPRCRGGK